MRTSYNLLQTFVFVALMCNCLVNSAQSKTSQEKRTGTDEVIAEHPPMGWNSWNWFGKHTVNEKIIVEVIDAIVESGLRDAGYEFVVIDGGWRDTKLGPNRELLPHPGKFPNGVEWLADYAHSKGLKFGLHTVPGTHDCIGDPVGGFGNEETHIRQLLDWGVDFVKLDKCRLTGGWSDQALSETYLKWGRLLREMSDRPVVLSISAYEWNDWSPEAGNMARTTEDICAKVAGMSGCQAVFDDPIPENINRWGMLNIMQIAEVNNEWAESAGSGFWNDPDMLVTGDHGLNNDEQKSHFALWCIMSAPLMLGNDPRNMVPEELAIISNQKAIAINQDPTEQGRRLLSEGNTEVWAKQLVGGDVAILLLNRNKHQQKTVSLDLEDVGITSEVGVEDVFANKQLGTASGKITYAVGPRASLFLKLTR